MSLRDEILEQPDVAARFLADQADAIEADRGVAPRPRPIGHVVIAARGTSDHAAIYAQYVLGVRHGLSVGARDAVDRVAVRRGARRRATRSSSAISQSGASPDIVAVIAAARAQGAPTIAITNEPDSALAAAADRTIALGAGPERAIAATKTYTAELLAIATLSAALTGDAADRRARRGDPRGARRALELEPDIERIAADQAAATRALVIARGYEYATAREWALKLKELAHVFADPYSAADFQHGPLALVEPGVPVLAVARAGAPEADLVALLARLRTDLDADADGRLGRARRARRSRRWPVALPAGHARVARPDRVDRRRASSTRSTSRARAASIRSVRGTSPRSRARPDRRPEAEARLRAGFEGQLRIEGGLALDVHGTGRARVGRHEIRPAKARARRRAGEPLFVRARHRDPTKTRVTDRPVLAVRRCDRTRRERRRRTRNRRG